MASTARDRLGNLGADVLHARGVVVLVFRNAASPAAFVLLGDHCKLRGRGKGVSVCYVHRNIGLMASFRPPIYAGAGRQKEGSSVVWLLIMHCLPNSIATLHTQSNWIWGTYCAH